MPESKVYRVRNNTIHSTVRFSFSLAMPMDHSYNISTNTNLRGRNPPIRATSCSAPQHE